jgi:hypothetical protein
MACKMGKYKTRCIFDAGKQSLVYAAESGKKPVSYMALSVRFSISEDYSEPVTIMNREMANVSWDNHKLSLLPFLRFFLLAHGIKLH